MSLSRTFILFVALAPLTFGASKEIVELQRDVAMLQDQVQKMQAALSEKLTTIQTLVQGATDNVKNTDRAVAVMQEKGMSSGDAAFKEIVANRALTVLRRLAKRGTVIKHGTSRDAQWALVHQFAGVSEF